LYSFISFFLPFVIFQGVSPETASYNMTVPTWSTLTTGAIPVKLYPAGAENYAKCVARIRYNVSTDDYNPWNISDESNDDNNVIQQDPAVDVEGIEIQLQLALNTNQYGRTFQVSPSNNQQSTLAHFSVYLIYT
jgi:hypothetical protein